MLHWNLPHLSLRKSHRALAVYRHGQGPSREAGPGPSSMGGNEHDSEDEGSDVKDKVYLDLLMIERRELRGITWINKSGGSKPAGSDCAVDESFPVYSPTMPKRTFEDYKVWDLESCSIFPIHPQFIIRFSQRPLTLGVFKP